MRRDDKSSGRAAAGGKAALERGAADEATVAQFPAPAPAPDSYRAADLGSIRDVLRRAKEYRFDRSLLKQREGYRDRGGRMHYFSYYEWHSVADALDELCPEWEFRIESQQVIGELCTVVASIGLVGYEPNGQRIQVWRAGVGVGAADTETGIKKAEHDALKRAAVKFGLARELYKEESDAIERTGAPPAEGEKPRQVLGTNERDTATPKQVGMIRAKCRDLTVDSELAAAAEWPDVEGLAVERLSKKAASWFIDQLKKAEGGDTGALAIMQADAPAGADAPPMCHCTPPKPAKLYTWDDTKGHHEVWACPDRKLSADRRKQIAGCDFTEEKLPF